MSSGKRCVLHIYFGQYLGHGIVQRVALSFLLRLIVVRSNPSIEKTPFRQKIKSGFLLSTNSGRPDAHTQSKNVVFSTRCASRIAQSKPFYRAIASLTPPLKKHTHPHIHALTTHILQQRRRWLGCYPSATLAVAFGGSRLSLTPRTRRSFGGFELSPMPPTRLHQGSSRVKHALLTENARSTAVPTDFRLPYSGTHSHQPPPGRVQNCEIDSTDDKETHNNPI